MFNARNQQHRGLSRQSIRAGKAQFSQEPKRGLQLGLRVGNEKPWAPNYRLPYIGERDLNNIDEKIENRVYIGVRIGGEELRVHVENPSGGGALDAHGGEAFGDGEEGGDGGAAEVGVFVEGFCRVYSQGFEVE